MNISVDVRKDKKFMEDIKSIILQKLNEILKDNFDLNGMIDKLVKKWVERRQENIIMDSVKNYIKNLKVQVRDPIFGYSYRTTSMSIEEYVKSLLQTETKRAVAEKVKELLKDVKIGIPK